MIPCRRCPFQNWVHVYVAGFGAIGCGGCACYLGALLRPCLRVAFLCGFRSSALLSDGIFRFRGIVCVGRIISGDVE